jgi:chemotaxis protein MotB
MAESGDSKPSKSKAPVIVVKKIVHGGHGHHGGAWKVAYADFVTAMMAFFLVMWLMGADEATKAAIERYFTQADAESPLDMQVSDFRSGETFAQMDVARQTAGRSVDLPVGKTEADARSRMAELREKLEEQLSVELGVTALSEEIKVLGGEEEEVGLRIAVKDLFKPGSSEVEKDLIPVLRKIGAIVAKTGSRIRIDGHADPSEGPDRYGNLWALSSARAAWVADFWSREPGLTDLAGRLQVTGRGGASPVAASDKAEGRAANRRVEVHILTATSGERGLAGGAGAPAGGKR